MNRNISPGIQQAIGTEERTLHVRCRVYQSERITEDAVEVWDFVESPVDVDLPGEPEVFVDPSRREVRSRVNAYLVGKEFFAVGSWNYRCAL